MDYLETLSRIREKLQGAVEQDKKLRNLYEKVVKGTATYEDANLFAQITGQYCGDIIVESLLEAYPSGAIPEAAAVVLIPRPLQDNYDLVVDFVEEVQEKLNERAGIGLNPVKPSFNANRARGLAAEVSRLEDLSQYSKIFKLQVENAALSVVDDAVRQNAKAHTLAGLKPKVVRTYDGVGLHNGKDVCEYCASKAGEWDYESAIKNSVFARHPGCHCEIAYITAKRTDVQSNWNRNEWTQVRNSDTIEARRRYGLNELSDPDTGMPIQFMPNSRPVRPRDHLLAGKGSNKEIRIIDQLTPIGGRAPDWKHEKAYYRIVDPNGSSAFVEMHWFQCEGIPGRYREYIKEREGEWYFYDIKEWENKWRW